jgi:hypothetical protein
MLLQVLPGCYLFDQPVNLLDNVFVAHMCNGVPAKVAEKLVYYGWWNQQWAKALEGGSSSAATL